MSYVKVVSGNLYDETYVKYRGCILETVDEGVHQTTCKDVNGNIIQFRNSSLQSLNAEERLRIQENPGFLASQPCYQEAVGFKVGDYVVDDRLRHVHIVKDLRDGLVYVRDTCEGCSHGYRRGDMLTKLDLEDAVGEDCISGMPIFEESEDYTYTLYHTSGEVKGQILPMTTEVCSDEVFHCDDCGEWYVRDHGDGYYEDDNGTVICESCYEDNGWYTCDNCGCLTRDGHEYGGSWYCESCYEEMDHGTMHDYCYKPDPYFHVGDGETEDDSTLFMGVELEVDKGNSVSQCLRDLHQYSDDEDLFYCKHDGSLRDGIEIVSHPCTLKYHLDNFPWPDVMTAARDNGFKSHDAVTCGLHVHVSRSALGADQLAQDFTIAKIIILVDRFWDELVKFSRRDYEQVERWTKKPNARIYSFDSQETAVEKAKRSGRDDRYKAVNLCNEATIEFRLFRGTLALQTFRATLQFVSNLVRYAMQASLSDIQNSRWSDITTFVTYPELTAYLESRDLTDVPDKPKPEEPKPIVVNYKVDDRVIFNTQNTNHQDREGVVQSVYPDYETMAGVLYVVEDDAGNVNFLVDNEISGVVEPAPAAETV